MKQGSGSLREVDWIKRVHQRMERRKIKWSKHRLLKRRWEEELPREELLREDFLATEIILR